VARAPHPLPLDPSLADPAWAAGKIPLGSGPWENVTTRSPSRYATTAYLLYDDKNLYVAFEAEQDGVPITASQSTNDVGFGQDDFVGIGVDTSGTGSQTYYFEATPRGIRYEQANENTRFRPRWTAAAAIGQGKWSAVLIVPLDVIRVPRGGKQTWRFQFVRGIAARGEHLSWVWDPIMQDAASGTWPLFSPDTRFWPAGQLDLAASAAARPKPRADIYALASIGQDRSLVQQANGTFLPMNVRWYGGDVSYPLTPTLRFVGTLNPDFSNVEIDQQTIAPQEFQRQLVEYRPFFAQGAAYINANSAVRQRRESRRDVRAECARSADLPRLRRHDQQHVQRFGLRLPARAAGWVLHVLERRRLRQPQHRRLGQHDRERLRGSQPAERDDLLRRLLVREWFVGTAGPRRPRGVLGRPAQGQLRNQRRTTTRSTAIPRIPTSAARNSSRTSPPRRRRSRTTRSSSPPTAFSTTRVWSTRPTFNTSSAPSSRTSSRSTAPARRSGSCARTAFPPDRAAAARFCSRPASLAIRVTATV
jgi:hypothetical protein